MRFLAGFAFLVLACASAPAATDPLSGGSLRKLLSGNSIVHPNFGCVHYRADGTTRAVGQSGQTGSGEWRVRGDLYYSNGQCGQLGCRVTGHYPSFTFRRLDGGYEQPVLLIRGNYCEKNGIFS